MTIEQGLADMDILMILRLIKTNSIALQFAWRAMIMSNHKFHLLHSPVKNFLTNRLVAANVCNIICVMYRSIVSFQCVSNGRKKRLHTFLILGNIMANANNYTHAVDKLVMMFPTVERPQIQNILVNECGGDTTKSIVILTKIQQFNRSMNNANPNQPKETFNAGESIQPTAAVTPQQIPLQVVVPQPTAYTHTNASGNMDPDCCATCCGPDSCACCLMKPASYTNGLYRIDYRMYNTAFFMFAAMTAYPDCTLESLDTSYHGLYLPIAGLVLIALAAGLQLFVSNDNDVGARNTCGSLRGCLYIFGGLFYFLGYMIHAATVPDPASDYWYWTLWSDIYAEPEYLVGRGLFVGIHAMFIGYAYVTNNRLPTFLNSRLRLIRFWTVLFIVYHVLVLCYLLPRWYFIFYPALTPVILVIALMLNLCLLRKSNESGGCNCGVSLGLMAVISYYFQMLVFVGIVIASWAERSNDVEEPGWYVLWEFAMFIFGSMQLWILTRAMHPVNANCGCVHDGSGDGNVVSRYSPGQAQSSSVVMVVQPQADAAPQAMMSVPTVVVNPMQNVPR
eukprot:676225_1